MIRKDNHEQISSLFYLREGGLYIKTIPRDIDLGHSVGNPGSLDSKLYGETHLRCCRNEETVHVCLHVMERLAASQTLQNHLAALYSINNSFKRLLKHAYFSYGSNFSRDKLISYLWFVSFKSCSIIKLGSTP